MKRLLTRIVKTSLVVFLICGLIYWINPRDRFRLDFNKFNIPECEIVKSEHIVGCGIDVDEAEVIFLQLREFFAVQNINAKVKIYKADKILFDAIGYLDGKPVAGVYLNGIFGIDIIIYNGDKDILMHELTHHIHNHMSSHRQDETFTWMAESYFAVLNEYELLSQQCANIETFLLSHFTNRAQTYKEDQA